MSIIIDRRWKMGGGINVLLRDESQSVNVLPGRRCPAGGEFLDNLRIAGWVLIIDVIIGRGRGDFLDSVAVPVIDDLDRGCTGPPNQAVFEIVGVSKTAGTGGVAVIIIRIGARQAIPSIVP